MNPARLVSLNVRKRARAYLGYARAMLYLRAPTKPHFVLLSGGRRGSHLLIDLLNSHSEFHVDGELLHENAVFGMAAPRLYLRGFRMRHHQKIHGYKTSLDQLKNQSIEPQVFLEKVVGNGGRIICLYRRNELRAAISREIAHIRGRHRDTVENPLQGQTFHIDCRDVVSGIRRRTAVRQAETGVLRNLPHLLINYEDDLLWPDCHQQTCNRIFRYLGCDSQTVMTTHTRRSPADLSEVVSNFDEVVTAVEQAGLSEFLRDDEYETPVVRAA
ncbi:MAG: hypothetical protein ABGZ35_02485 [Planctomycetaceae bacterium]|jgi:hypothetical protein